MPTQSTAANALIIDTKGNIVDTIGKVVGGFQLGASQFTVRGQGNKRTTYDIPALCTGLKTIGATLLICSPDNELAPSDADLSSAAARIKQSATLTR